MKPRDRICFFSVVSLFHIQEIVNPEAFLKKYLCEKFILCKKPFSYLV